MEKMAKNIVFVPKTPHCLSKTIFRLGGSTLENVYIEVILLGTLLYCEQCTSYLALPDDIKIYAPKINANSFCDFSIPPPPPPICKRSFWQNGSCRILGHPSPTLCGPSSNRQAP